MWWKMWVWRGSTVGLLASFILGMGDSLGTTFCICGFRCPKSRFTFLGFSFSATTCISVTFHELNFAFDETCGLGDKVLVEKFGNLADTNFFDSVWGLVYFNSCMSRCLILKKRQRISQSLRYFRMFLFSTLLNFNLEIKSISYFLNFSSNFWFFFLIILFKL